MKRKNYSFSAKKTGALKNKVKELLRKAHNLFHSRKSTPKEILTVLQEALFKSILLQTSSLQKPTKNYVLIPNRKNIDEQKELTLLFIYSCIAVGNLVNIHPELQETTQTTPITYFNTAKEALKSLTEQINSPALVYCFGTHSIQSKETINQPFETQEMLYKEIFGLPRQNTIDFTLTQPKNKKDITPRTFFKKGKKSGSILAFDLETGRYRKVHLPYWINFSKQITALREKELPRDGKCALHLLKIYKQNPRLAQGYKQLELALDINPFLCKIFGKQIINDCNESSKKWDVWRYTQTAKTDKETMSLKKAQNIAGDKYISYWLKIRKMFEKKHASLTTLQKTKKIDEFLIWLRINQGNTKAYQFLYNLEFLFIEATDNLKKHVRYPTTIKNFIKKNMNHRWLGLYETVELAKINHQPIHILQYIPDSKQFMCQPGLSYTPIQKYNAPTIYGIFRPKESHFNEGIPVDENTIKESDFVPQKKHKRFKLNYRNIFGNQWKQYSKYHIKQLTRMLKKAKEFTAEEEEVEGENEDENIVHLRQKTSILISNIKNELELLQFCGNSCCHLFYLYKTLKDRYYGNEPYDNKSFHLELDRLNLFTQMLLKKQVDLEIWNKFMSTERQYKFSKEYTHCINSIKTTTRNVPAKNIQELSTGLSIFIEFLERQAGICPIAANLLKNIPLQTQKQHQKKTNTENVLHHYTKAKKHEKSLIKKILKHKQDLSIYSLYKLLESYVKNLDPITLTSPKIQRSFEAFALLLLAGNSPNDYPTIKNLIRLKGCPRVCVNIVRKLLEEVENEKSASGKSSCPFFQPIEHATLTTFNIMLDFLTRNHNHFSHIILTVLEKLKKTIKEKQCINIRKRPRTASDPSDKPYISSPLRHHPI